MNYYKDYTKYLIKESIIIVLLLCFYLLNSFNNINKLAIDVRALPENSIITMNGKEINSGKHRVYPGDYEFTAVANGYEDDMLKVFIKEDKTAVGLLPEPLNEDAESYFSDPKLQEKRELYGSARASLVGDAYRDASPLINLLPYTAFQYNNKKGPFTVGFGPSEEREEDVFLIITNSSPNGRQNALSWIRDQGYNTADYEIRFSDYVDQTGGID